MRVLKSVVSILAGLALLTVVAPQARAAVPKIPITCGMVVQQDAVLYLKKNLHCPDFGIRVVQEPGVPGPGPHVVVDLRGHTLSGSGTAAGIAANNAGGSDFITVINGRLSNWDTAISGDWDTRTRRVSLVGNRVGFFCSGICVVDRTAFRNNTGTGLFVGGEASATVTRSRFRNNAVGASVLYPWSLSVDRSTFVKNVVGLLDDGSQVPVSRSLFVKNQTAILVDDSDGLGACVDLHKVVFVKNGISVDGPVCAP